MGRTEGSAHHNKAWPEETTSREVLEWASRELSTKLILIEASERSQDTEQMNVHIKAMRTVVTRLDAFRRLRVRQWRVQPASSPKSTSTQAGSET